MQVIGKHNPSMDDKGITSPHRLYGIAEEADMACQQIGVPL
jgi:hypothetical protein